MRRLVLSCLSLAVGCGGSQEPGTTSAALCRAVPEASAPGTGGASTTHVAPTSRLGVAVEISRASFENALRRAVPEVVAEGRHVPAGTAGRTTFTIKRGEPRLDVVGSNLKASVALDGEIHLCKPFGGVCIEYGMCRPRWTAEVAVRSPWVLGDEPDVALDVDITKGCVLSPVKVDVTSELRKITDAEVRKVRKQLDAELRKFHRSLAKQLKRAASNSFSSSNPCLTFQVDEVRLALAQTRGDYTANVQAMGRISVACDAAVAPLTEQTRVVLSEELQPTTELHLDTRVPFANLVAEWQPRVPQHQVRVSSHRDAARGELLLVEVAGWQGCASGWVMFQPLASSSGATLQVEDTSDPNLPTVLGVPPSVVNAGLEQPRRAARLDASLARPITVDSELLDNPLELRVTPRLAARESAFVGPDAVILRSTLAGAVEANVSEPR